MQIVAGTIRRHEFVNRDPQHTDGANSWTLVLSVRRTMQKAAIFCFGVLAFRVETLYLARRFCGLP